MRFKTGTVTDGKDDFVIVTWGGHYPSCEKCREIDLAKPAQFVGACVVGSQLLVEHFAILRAPEAREKAERVKAWAKKAGVFKGA